VAGAVSAAAVGLVVALVLSRGDDSGADAESTTAPRLSRLTSRDWGVVQLASNRPLRVRERITEETRRCAATTQPAGVVLCLASAYERHLADLETIPERLENGPPTYLRSGRCFNAYLAWIDRWNDFGHAASEVNFAAQTYRGARDVASRESAVAEIEAAGSAEDSAERDYASARRRLLGLCRP
jgi:hypothetical protein